MSLTSSVPVLRVSDYQRARAFWEGVLGFEVIEEAGDPIVGFGIFRQDRAQVFLTAWDGPEASYDRWRAYFHSDDLDTVISRLDVANQTYRGPTVTECGMREVEITDPDGNTVCFGQDAS